MAQSLIAFGVIVATVSCFIYWLIRSNQKLATKRFEDELDRSKGHQRAKKAGDDVLAEPLGTDEQFLADQQRLHDDHERRRQAKEG